MGNNARTHLAAELGRSENRADFDDNPAEKVNLSRRDLPEPEEISSSDYDGVVILDERRRAAKTESSLGRRRSLRRTAPSSGGPNEIGEQIGEHLRSLYDDVLNQPVPDRFLELLNKLETDTISPARSKTPGER